MPHLEVLETELRRFQLELSSQQKTTLARYCDELERWNKKINLTGLKGVEMVRRLIVEPAWIGVQLEMNGVLADIGSGNGSPAIPLHVVAAHLDAMHMIEARARRAAFLRHIVNFLELPEVTVHRTRLEEMESELKDVDWVTLQGVALTPELLDSIKKIAITTTTVVWITSDPHPPIAPFKRFLVPSTNTEVLLFHLDLS